MVGHLKVCAKFQIDQGIGLRETLSAKQKKKAIFQKTQLRFCNEVVTKISLRDVATNSKPGSSV